MSMEGIVHCPSCNSTDVATDESFEHSERGWTCRGCSHRWEAIPPGDEPTWEAGVVHEPRPVRSQDD